MKQNQASFLARYTLQTFAIILGVGILLRVFFISSFVMSGQSMLPSIWPGDFLFATKWRVGELKRGQVVSMHCPFDRDQICLKRVVGLAGDRIEFVNGKLNVNGAEASHREISPEIVSEAVGDSSWLIWPHEGASAAPLVVPPEHIFVLNDRREDVEDSRTWGPVQNSLVEARATRIWLSLDWMDGAEVRTWPRVRWARLLRSIN